MVEVSVINRLPKVSKDDVLNAGRHAFLGKNNQFSNIMDFLLHSGRCTIQRFSSAALEIYGDPNLGNLSTKDQTYGERRLAAQRLGRKSFIDKEGAFWYHWFGEAFGPNFLAEFTPKTLVTASLEEILEALDKHKVEFDWTALQGGLGIKALAASGLFASTRSSIALRPMKNERFTNIHHAEARQFRYETSPNAFTHGDKFTLTVEGVNRNQSVTMIEFSERLILQDNYDGPPVQAQLMPFLEVSGPNVHVVDQSGNDELVFGQSGMLAGQFGFAAIVHSSQWSSNDLFKACGIAMKDELLTADDLKSLVIGLRTKFSKQDIHQVCVVDYWLEYS